MKTKLPTQVDFAAPAHPVKGDVKFVDSRRAQQGLPDFSGAPITNVPQRRPDPVTTLAPNRKR